MGLRPLQGRPATRDRRMTVRSALSTGNIRGHVTWLAVAGSPVKIRTSVIVNRSRGPRTVAAGRKHVEELEAFKQDDGEPLLVVLSYGCLPRRRQEPRRPGLR